jgi:hypothetical protein
MGSWFSVVEWVLWVLIMWVGYIEGVGEREDA